MDSFQEYISRSKHRYGDKFDPSDLAEKFIPYYESGQRIIVKTPWGEEERGYVGVTTGWKPSFLLMHRCNDISSPTLLSARYEITGTVNRYNKPGVYRPRY